MACTAVPFPSPVTLPPPHSGTFRWVSVPSSYTIDVHTIMHVDFNLQFAILFSILIHLNNLSLLSVCCCFCPGPLFLALFLQSLSLSRLFVVVIVFFFSDSHTLRPTHFSRFVPLSRRERASEWVCHVFRVLCMFCWAFLCTKSYSTGNYIQNEGNSSFFRIPVDLFLAFTTTRSRRIHPFFIVCVDVFFCIFSGLNWNTKCRAVVEGSEHASERQRQVSMTKVVFECYVM